MRLCFVSVLCLCRVAVSACLRLCMSLCWSLLFDWNECHPYEMSLYFVLSCMFSSCLVLSCLVLFLHLDYWWSTGHWERGSTGHQADGGNCGGDWYRLARCGKGPICGCDRYRVLPLWPRITAKHCGVRCRICSQGASIIPPTHWRPCISAHNITQHKHKHKM